MIIYILRHAEAESVAASDGARKLTAKGHEQATRMGKFCREQKIIPQLVLTSPVCRARETALHIVDELKNVELIEVPWIACGMSPEAALVELNSYAAFESVMLVGHEPDLSSLITHLLGLNDSQSIDVSKASLTAIELKKLTPRAGVLQFFIPCELASIF